MSLTILDRVSWKTYECLLADYADRAGPRFTYDRGVLEIMSPLPVHERRNRLVARLVETVLEEWGVGYENLGSTTFRSEALERGVEPDTCFYLGDLERVADLERVDLAAGDPAPDLVIEVDITHGSVDKLPIFAAFGVPEVWRVGREGVEILLRDGPTYATTEVSTALPGLTREAMTALLAPDLTRDRLAWVAAVRRWARENAPRRP
jgi:Uma2 family endonuclease